MATAVALPAPVLPFGSPQEELKPVAVVTAEHSLLEIDREMDVLFDHIQDELEEAGEPSQESKDDSSSSAMCSAISASSMRCAPARVFCIATGGTGKPSASL